MNKKPLIREPGIIASTINIPSNGNFFGNVINKSVGLPLREIEVELDAIELAQRSNSFDNQMITAVINYPLGGYQANYILESIRWADEKNIGTICTNLPLYWLRSNESIKIQRLLREIVAAVKNSNIRISTESNLLSKEEKLILYDLLCDAGILQLKTSCGFAHRTAIEEVLYIRNNYPALLLTVDNNLRGDSPEIDNLFQSGVQYVCAKEPWLYHF